MLKSCLRVFVITRQSYLTVFWSSMMVDFHRLTEWLKVEGSARSLLVQTPSQATWSWLPNTASRQLLNLVKDGDSTVPLCLCLCQCLVTLTVKQDFLGLRRNLLSYTVCPLSLALSLGTPGKSLVLSCLHPSLGFLWKC